jgi:hypothetical protein
MAAQPGGLATMISKLPDFNPLHLRRLPPELLAPAKITAVRCGSEAGDGDTYPVAEMVDSQSWISTTR